MYLFPPSMDGSPQVQAHHPDDGVGGMQGGAVTASGASLHPALDVLTPIGPSFFEDDDTDRVAQALLGKVLISRQDGNLTAGRIVEVEAYLGSDDPGSHAATKGITQRNRTMYGPPGMVYVYFVYGNHHMLNLVTGPKGVAGAILIRALEPLAGLEVMQVRRCKGSSLDLANGPGKVAQSLGITMRQNGLMVNRGPLEIREGHPMNETEKMAHSGRIGLTMGHERKLRHYLQGNPFVSKGRTGPPKAKKRHKSEAETIPPSPKHKSKRE